MAKNLDNIKRQAKRIKKLYEIPHHKALDEAAQEEGYENFKHAQNALNRKVGMSPHLGASYTEMTHHAWSGKTSKDIYKDMADTINLDRRNNRRK